MMIDWMIPIEDQPREAFEELFAFKKTSGETLPLMLALMAKHSAKPDEFFASLAQDLTKIYGELKTEESLAAQALSSRAKAIFDKLSG